MKKQSSLSIIVCLFVIFQSCTTGSKTEFGDFPLSWTKLAYHEDELVRKANCGGVPEINIEENSLEVVYLWDAVKGSMFYYYDEYPSAIYGDWTEGKITQVLDDCIIMEFEGRVLRFIHSNSGEIIDFRKVRGLPECVLKRKTQKTA